MFRYSILADDERFSLIRCSQRAEALIRSKDPPLSFTLKRFLRPLSKTGLRVTIYTALAEAKSRADWNMSLFLAVINGYQFHVVKRKFTEVHRPVLGIADLYAVVEYPHVLAAHTTDVDGFQPP